MGATQRETNKAHYVFAIIVNSMKNSSGNKIALKISLLKWL